MTQDLSPVRRIAAHWVLTPHGFLRGGMITLDRQGRVVEVSAPDNLNSLSGVEFHSGMLIPGMVNAHTHLELSYLRGAIPPGCGFAGFAAALRERRGRFSEREITQAIDYHDARMWAEGVQAVGDVCNSGATFAVKRRSNIAYHSFIEIYGLNAGAAQAGRAQALRQEAIRAGLRATVTPHSTYSLNEEAFALAVGGRDNYPLSIHFMESPGEADLYRGRGEMKEWYGKAGFKTDFTSRYRCPAERIIKQVPAERKVLLVHDTMATAEDVEMLCSYFGKNLTLVLCPLSNRFITGLTPPAGMLEKSGARIAAGTDSLASNHVLSMIEELKAIKGIALETMLRWATSDGAEALGLDGEMGSFEPGKRPGVVLLTGIDWGDMSLTEHAETRRLA